jgi:hypothetical protein
LKENYIIEKISSIKKIDGAKNRMMSDLDDGVERKEENKEVPVKKPKISLKNLL